MGTASNPVDVSTIERRAKRKAKREAADLRVVLSTADGRRFLWRLLSECGTFGSVVRAGFGDQAHFLAGQQDVGHKLQAWILDANEGAYLTMQKEAWSGARQEVIETDAEIEALKAEHAKNHSEGEL